MMRMDIGPIEGHVKPRWPLPAKWNSKKMTYDFINLLNLNSPAVLTPIPWLMVSIKTVPSSLNGTLIFSKPLATNYVRILFSGLLTSEVVELSRF